MWSERHTMDSLLWEAALDDMGIYPRATVTDGIETPRTEWQDGWNAAVMGLTRKHSELLRWVNGLSPEQRQSLTKLLDSDGEPVLLQCHDGRVGLSLRCSDTFAYACSDLEDFTLDDLPEVERLWNAHGYMGTVAWIARKRRTEPVKEYRLESAYLKAKADL